MKRMVVTGGAGFIGSHLAEGLALENEVIVLDDFSQGGRENLAGLLQNSHVQFTLGSVTDLPLLERLFQGVDCVFHQAAICSVPRSIENPQAYHEANITGTLNVLLAARDNGVGKVVYVSSFLVYGDTLALPQREDMPHRYR